LGSVSRVPVDIWTVDGGILNLCFEWGKFVGEELYEFVHGGVIHIAEGGVFADFDETDAWVLKEGSDQFAAFFEGKAFVVREVDGGQVAAAEDVDVEVQEDSGGVRDSGEELKRGLMGADAAYFGEGE
jgi:hypothetical protein